MEKPVDQEQLSEYQRRFADWMGRQGLFFQVRHAGVVGSESVARQLGGLLLRFFIMTIAVVGVGYFLTIHYFSSKAYGETVTRGLEKSLGLKSITSDGFYRRRGSGGFRNLEMTGGPSSFFFNAKVGGLVAPFEFLTGINSVWKPSELRMDGAEIELKAGGDDGEMDTAFSGILRSLEGEGVRRVTINKLNCDWGYSKLTYGRIEGARFEADLEGGVWKVTLSGGKFQQNWLQGFQIIKASLSVSETGVKIHKLSLKHGNGTLSLSGEVTGPVSKPEVLLAGDFKHLPIESMLDIQGVQMRDFVSGAISGSLKIVGSTDRKIRTDVKVVLEKGDVVTLRERWAILKAVSVLDVDRTYRRVDFEKGGFEFTTEAGEMTISAIQLESGKLARLEGDLVTRLPNQAEAAESLGITLTDGFSGSFTTDLTDSSSAEKMKNARMSLSRAAEGGKRVSDFSFSSETGSDFLKKEVANRTPKEKESLQLMREMNVHRISGLLRLAIPAVAFEQYEQLVERYPKDENGWRWLDIPVASTFSQISSEAHQRILEESRIRDYEEVDKPGD
ncbi:MAG: hypothetical protein QNL33_09050 [Akkermansiaceae bacterium]